MAAGGSGNGLYDHLYKRFFEQRDTHQGYSFQDAPGGSVAPPTPEERAAVEYPGYVYDHDDSAAWNARASALERRSNASQLTTVSPWISAGASPSRLPSAVSTCPKLNIGVSLSPMLRH